MCGRGPKKTHMPSRFQEITRPPLPDLSESLPTSLPSQRDIERLANASAPLLVPRDDAAIAMMAGLGLLLLRHVAIRVLARRRVKLHGL